MRRAVAVALVALALTGCRSPWGESAEAQAKCDQLKGSYYLDGPGFSEADARCAVGTDVLRWTGTGWS